MTLVETLLKVPQVHVVCKYAETRLARDYNIILFYIIHLGSTFLFRILN